MPSVPSSSSPSACPSPAAPSPLDTSARLRAGATRTRVSDGGQQPASLAPGGALAREPRPADRAVSADESHYSSTLREALVPLVADHKCSSPEVYGADISPNMLCAGYFDCKSDACQVSPRLGPAAWGGDPAPRRARPRPRPKAPQRGREGRPSQERAHRGPGKDWVAEPDVPRPSRRGQGCPGEPAGRASPPEPSQQARAVRPSGQCPRLGRCRP